MTPPLIAVPAGPAVAAARTDRPGLEGIVVAVAYLDALRRAGAIEAVLAPLPLDPREVGGVLDRYDGLMLLGGGDVDPAAYGEQPATEVYEVSPERDECEIALTRAAVKRGMPLLAICRGHQVLNVALGGRLDQHITGRAGLVGHGIPGDKARAEVHEVQLDPTSRVAKAMGTTTPVCSSHHHQAVDVVPDALRVVGQAADGIVEAVEPADDRGPWVVGVQWHPEDTALEDPAQQGLFDAFVDQAARRRV